MPEHENAPFAALWRQTQQAQPSSPPSWSGTFEAYLARVEQEPMLARNAWQRLIDMIESHGVLRPEHCQAELAGTRSTRPTLRYKLFDDPFQRGRDAVFGLDAALDELVRTIRAGAQGLGPERRVILLHGPVGSAKSTIARLLKKGVELYSHSEAGALYSFEWHIDGEIVPSPMHQDPLLLVPQALRPALEERLNRKARASYRLSLEGELDPVSRFWVRQLLERHGGDYQAVLGHVRVVRLLLSESDRIGIGTFQPKDEKNQDSTELTGDLNWRRIAEVGSDSDPRAFNFDGEFNVANRGILELIEVLKLDVAFLYDLLGATQEHAIKPKKFALTSIDEVILGHTNEPEYKKLQANELMEAFRDRTIKIDVPYNLEISRESQIYARQFQPQRLAGTTLAPHALELAALWAVMTRSEDPSHPNLSEVQKARLYDGEELNGFSRENVVEMRAQAKREGMFGISPRYVLDRIAAALVGGAPVVTALDVLDQLEAGLAHHSLVSNEETRRRYVTLLAKAREEYAEIAKREVQAAIASDKQAIESLCTKYIEQVKAYVTRERCLGDDGAEREPDERLMRSLELKIDIAETRKDDFRHELMNYLSELARQGRVFRWQENKRLARALELKAFDDRRDTILLTREGSSVVDPDLRQRIEVVRRALMRLFGYDELAADELLIFVAGLFARGEAKSPALEAA